MGATLYGAEGLWLGRLGGANLYDAMLPETISSVDGSKTVWDATRSGPLVLFFMLGICALCALGVATPPTRELILDGQTVALARLARPADQRVLPDRSHRIGGVVRSFQFLLLRVWSSMSALPAVFPDGQPSSAAARGI